MKRSAANRTTKSVVDRGTTSAVDDVRFYRENERPYGVFSNLFPLLFVPFLLDMRAPPSGILAPQN